MPTIKEELKDFEIETSHVAQKENGALCTQGSVSFGMINPIYYENAGTIDPNGLNVQTCYILLVY